MAGLRTLTLRATLGAGLVLAAAPPAPAQTAAPDGCADAVARWGEFSAREDEGGHMDASVYKQIQGEIDRATQLCDAGQDAQASRAVADSKRRHGYPP